MKDWSAWFRVKSVNSDKRSKMEIKMKDEDIFTYISALKRDISYLNNELNAIKVKVKEPVRQDNTMIWYCLFIVFLMVMTR